jgi:hypothetical protein
MPEAKLLQFQRRHKRLDRPSRIVARDVIFDTRRKKAWLISAKDTFNNKRYGCSKRLGLMA